MASSRYVLIPPAHSTKIPGVTEQQWAYVELPQELHYIHGEESKSAGRRSTFNTEALFDEYKEYGGIVAAGKIATLLGISLEEAQGFSIGQQESGKAGAYLFEDSSAYNHWSGDNSFSGTASSMAAELKLLGSGANPFGNKTDSSIPAGSITQNESTKPYNNASVSIDVPNDPDPFNWERFKSNMKGIVTGDFGLDSDASPFPETSQQASPMGQSSTDMQLANITPEGRLTHRDFQTYFGDLDKTITDSSFQAAATAVSSPAEPGTYEVTTTTLDGLKNVITVQASSSGEAREAAKDTMEVGSKVGAVKQKAAPVAAAESAASAMLSQSSIDIEQFLASIPADKRFYEVEGVGFENPLVTSLLQLAQTGVTATSNLEIQRLAANNATAIAEFNRDAEIQIASDRGATDTAIATIRSKADIDIANSQEMATRFAAEQQRVTDKYVADSQAGAATDVATIQAAASGPYGFLGPMPEGGYTEDQLDLLRTLIKAEQQGAIDAAAATKAVGDSQAAAAKIGAQDNIFSYAAANPEATQQDLTNLAGMSPEARMAQATVAAAQASADAQLSAVGLQSQRELDAAIARGASDEEIATITTQAQNLQQQIQTQSNQIIAGLQQQAQEAVATTQAGAVTDAAATQAGAQTTVAQTQAGAVTGAATIEAEAAEAIAALQNIVGLDENTKALAIAQLQTEAQQAIAGLQADATTGAATTQAGATTGAAQIQAQAAEAIAQIQADVSMDENSKAVAIANIQTQVQQAIAELQTSGATTAAATQAQAASPYGYLAGGGQLADVQAILSGQYNPFGQDSADMLNLARAQASGGLTNEANILGVQQAAAATNPYAATQLGQDSGRIDQILRGGLTAEQQRQLTLAGQAGQMQGNYLNYISNPFAVGASQTLSGGTAAPFSQQQLQQVSDSPSGTIPSFAVGLGTSPFALPETQAIGSAQGLPANFTLGDWANRSDVEQQSVAGQLSPYGITPNMIGERAASYTPGSTQTVSSYT